MKPSERLLAALLIGTALATPPPGLAQQARPRPAPILAERLIGRWADSGDCARFVAFRGDGTFRTHAGGEGRWRLARGRLTLSGGGPDRVLAVRRLDSSVLEVINPDGSIGVSRRCPGVQPGPASDRRP